MAAGEEKVVADSTTRDGIEYLISRFGISGRSFGPNSWKAIHLELNISRSPCCLFSSFLDLRSIKTLRDD